MHVSEGGSGSRLTVRDVLRLDLIASFGPEVVAGAAGLDRPVRWVHVAEALDVGVMLSGGEMVLTTGLLLADDPKAQTAYMESMHGADVAAVVLGLGRAFATTPPALRRAAEQRGMPLIVLHRPAPFAKFTEEVHARLLNERFAAVDLSDRLRSALAALNLSGASLQRLLDEIAAFAGCPVMLVNLAQRVLATAGDRAALSELTRDWDRVSRQVAALATQGSPTPTPTPPSASTSRATTAGPDGWLMAPLEARGQQWARLLLFGYRGPAAEGRMVAERAAEALAVHRLVGGGDAYTHDGLEGEAAQAMLADLASGTVRPDQLLPRVRALGLPVNRRTFVPLIIRPLNDGTEPLDLLFRRALTDEGLAGLAAETTTTTGATPSTAVLVSLPRDQDAATAVDRLVLKACEHSQSHSHSPTRGTARRIVVGAGFDCSALDELPRSFAEAVHVADAAVADPPAGPVARLRDVRLRGLVRLLRDEPELQAFIERELGPLFAEQDLLDVLRSYLRTGRNKSLAAQEHHFSRPALYRRLRSIETLLGVDLDDWDQLVSLYVALLAYDAQQASGATPID
jgi:PucR family transcriptional regulator, purine catabolism regulatory protein